MNVIKAVAQRLWRGMRSSQLYYEAASSIRTGLDI